MSFDEQRRQPPLVQCQPGAAFRVVPQPPPLRASSQQAPVAGRVVEGTPGYVTVVY